MYVEEEGDAVIATACACATRECASSCARVQERENSLAPTPVNTRRDDNDASGHRMASRSSTSPRTVAADSIALRRATLLVSHSLHVLSCCSCGHDDGDSWVGELLKRGAAAPLRAEDLWDLQPADDTTHVAAALAHCLAQDLHAARPLSLWRAIRRVCTATSSQQQHHCVRSQCSQRARARVAGVWFQHVPRRRVQVRRRLSRVCWSNLHQRCACLLVVCLLVAC